MLRRILDATVDSAVVSFAFWTLLYCLGLATQWSLWGSGWLWLVFTVALLGWQLTLAARPGSDEPVEVVEAAEPVDARHPERARLALLIGLGATVVAGLGGLVWTAGTFKITWVATAGAIAALLGASYLSGRIGAWQQPQAASPARSGLRADLVVLAVAVGAAVVSLFIHLADTDDPYYLNRSVWVAEQGNAALQDTMFSPEVFNSPYGGGIPIASIEGLLGVIAHMTGVRAGTATYLLATPVATALAVWAIWRLARRWAPRRALLVCLVAVAFLMLSGDSMLGNFWVPRMWQGKVMAVSFLMPLIWAYLTEAYEATSLAERRRSLVLLLAAGVAFFGLTPTAVVWGGLMFGAVLLAAILLRSKVLALAGALMVVGPLLSGAAVVLFSTEVGGREPTTLSAHASFVRILGETAPMVALGLVALALAPVVARRGAPAALAGAAALVSVWVFAPGILSAVNAVTGSGPILWRMLYVAPIPILVGLLVTLPWPRDGASPHRRAATVGLAAVVLAGLALGGKPVWSNTGHGGPVTVSARPEWKLDVEALRDVRLLADEGIEGVVLLPPGRMKVLTMYTTDAFPVVPRQWFIANIDEPKQSERARRLLLRVAEADAPLPGERVVRQALARLDVNLACIGKAPRRLDALGLLRAAGYGDERRVGSLSCLRRSTA